VDFTREPVIESVITPKEGFILAVRSSKGAGQEEYFVDAIELVSFGNALFFRSLERPKNFLLPVSDYEVLEVREARLVLKNVGLDRSIKIAGGREGAMRGGKTPPQEKTEQPQEPSEVTAKADKTQPQEVRAEGKLDKRRDRRRNSRRKRGTEEETTEAAPAVATTPLEEGVEPAPVQKREVTKPILPESVEIGAPLPAVFSSLLPPPATLISETIARYKDNALFRGAFFLKDEKDSSEQAEGESKDLEDDSTSTTGEEGSEAPKREKHVFHYNPEKPLLDFPEDNDDVQIPTMTLDYPEYVSREMTEEEEERVYQQRQALRLSRQASKDVLEEAETLPQQAPSHDQESDENNSSHSS
jgi:hypothetical protein